MRSDQERSEKLFSILQMAQTISRKNPNHPACRAALEHLTFCANNGYVGFPTESHTKFDAGSYLRTGRTGGPTTLLETQSSLGIIVCFSEEIMPCNPLTKVTSKGTNVEVGAYISPKDRILVMGYTDLHTPVELAFDFLHEARHARHRFGHQFEGLAPLESEDVHESRTWKHELDLLDIYGGPMWQQAVEREWSFWKARCNAQTRSPGEKFWGISNETYPELDTVFGPDVGISSRGDRKLKVALRAHFLVAERAQLPDLDTAYATLIGRYYDWCREPH